MRTIYVTIKRYSYDDVVVDTDTDHIDIGHIPFQRRKSAKL